MSADEDRIVLEVMDLCKPFVMVLRWNRSKSCFIHERGRFSLVSIFAYMICVIDSRCK